MEEQEGRAVVQQRADSLLKLSFDELDKRGEVFEVVQTPSGIRFLVKSIALWDMDPWESDMCVSVEAHVVDTQRRKYWEYSAWEVLGPPGER